MLISQLREINNVEQIPVGPGVSRQDAHGAGSEGFRTPHNPVQNRCGLAVPSSGSEPPSDHTKIWSNVTGSGTKSVSREARSRQLMQDSADASEEIPRGIQRQQTLKQHAGIQAVPERTPQQWKSTGPVLYSAGRGNLAGRSDAPQQTGGITSINPVDCQTMSTKNMSNWISADSEDEGNEGEPDLFVQSTPPRNIR